MARSGSLRTIKCSRPASTAGLILRRSQPGVSKFSFTLLVAFITGTSSLPAQTTGISFERISLNEGLSQSVIQAIYKDRVGFMWFGTESGLNRYDGYTFTVYKLDPFDSSSIASNNILSIREDSSGALWIGTNGGGLNRFDRESNSFTRYLPRVGDPTSLSANIVPSAFCDRYNVVWAATIAGGLDRLDPETGTFIRYRHDPDDSHSLSSNALTAGTEDRSGRLWMGTLDGLNLYDRERDRFIRFTDSPTDSIPLSNSRILSVYEAPSEPGILWIGTGNPANPAQGGGLNRLDIGTGSITSYRHNAHVPGSISSDVAGPLLETRSGDFWVGTARGLNRLNRRTGEFRAFLPDPARPALPTNSILSINEDVSGNLWIVTRANDGIYRFDPRNGSFTHCVNDRGNPASLSNDIVRGVMTDTTGVVWIGTNTGGISKLDLFAEKFRTFASEPGNPNSLSDNLVRSILEDSKGDLWVGVARGGLNRFNRSRTKVTHYRFDPSDPSSLSDDNVWSLCEDRNGTIWVGTLNGGLNRFNHASGTFTRYLAEPRNPSRLASNAIRVIFEDPDGTLWCGTDGGGVNTLDVHKGTFTRFLTVPGDSTSLSNNFVRAIARTEDGMLWFGTFGGGLNRFDPARGTFTRYQANPQNPNALNHNAIQSISVGRDGVLWIGTFGGGLDRFDPRTGIARHFTEQNSNLPNNVIYGVLTDQKGCIWVSSNRGLSKLDPHSAIFENFDISDGLQSKEFNGQACYAGTRGELFFGGIDGLNAFFPDSVRSNPYPPAIVITEFRLFDEPVRIGSDSPLSRHITETSAISLAHWQNDISFDFVALQFNRPEENRYSYMLDNYDKGWRKPGTQRTATYTNLDPGEYVFRVRGSNSDGVWNETGASIKVTIRRPWWTTGFAVALYVLLGVSLIFGTHRVQHLRVTRKEQERARVREAELRAQAAEAQTLAMEAEHRRQTHELEEARKIQLSMLPRVVPRLPQLDIAVYMQTATEVGGDYYDFSLDGGDTLTVVVGDATGHGLKAGTMVSVIKGLFIAEAPHMDIRDFLSTCTRTVRELHLGNLFMGLTLLQIKDHTLSASIAGMPPFYIYRKQTGSVEEVVLKGMPIGAFENFEYKEIQRTLEQGDTILLLSDGLVELFNTDNETFDYHRVKEAFATTGSQNPAEIIDGLVAAGERWRNGRPLHDDVTFVVMKMKT